MNNSYYDNLMPGFQFDLFFQMYYPIHTLDQNYNNIHKELNIIYIQKYNRPKTEHNSHLFYNILMNKMEHLP